MTAVIRRAESARAGAGRRCVWPARIRRRTDMAATKLNLRLLGRTCGKTRHWPEAAAREVIEDLAAKDRVQGREPPNLHVYRCRRCGGAFHVGHARPDED